MRVIWGIVNPRSRLCSQPRITSPGLGHDEKRRMTDHENDIRQFVTFATAPAEALHVARVLEAALQS